MPQNPGATKENIDTFNSEKRDWNFCMAKYHEKSQNTNHEIETYVKELNLPIYKMSHKMRGRKKNPTKEECIININKQFVEKIRPMLFKNIRILSFTHIKRYINKQRSLQELLGKREYTECCENKVGWELETQILV